MESMEITSKLLTKVENLGYGQEVKDQINEARAKGLLEFSAGDIRTFKNPDNIGNYVVEYQLNFAPSANDNNSSYLQTIESLLTRDIFIPHRVIEGVNTREVESFIVETLQSTANKQQLPEAVVNQIDERMKWALEHAPDTFSALLIQYNPPIHFTIPDAIVKEAEALQLDKNRYNIFSSYYNLTALEIANTMQGRFARKNLFKKASADRDTVGANHVQKSNQVRKLNDMFTSWVEVAFDRPRRPDGACEIILHSDFDIRPTLAQLNFIELRNMYDRGRMIDFLEKGSLVLFNNGNQNGESQVLGQVNPIYRGMDLFKLDGEPITNHRLYLKDRRMEVGAYVELKKGSVAPPQEEKKTIDPPDERAKKFNNSKKEAIAASLKDNPTHNTKNVVDKPAVPEHKRSADNTAGINRRNARTVRENGSRKGQRR
ncbi:hypothetical protein [Niastella sp. OAS944]|uniref:hypothetical protein n=1 Tax=Niastella sp. OAS944 TaxID=2664089 RepID=UPI003472DE99|nr:hypothetical protein [Chitinophagaceae bacterium OAS944]